MCSSLAMHVHNFSVFERRLCPARGTSEFYSGLSTQDRYMYQKLLFTFDSGSEDQVLFCNLYVDVMLGTIH